MATRVELPQLGESVHEGTIGKWLKKVGEDVKLYEPIAEISTDKVDAEMPSPVAGTLLRILVPEGSTVKAHSVIAVVGARDEKLLDDASALPTPPAAAEQATAGAKTEPAPQAQVTTGAPPAIPFAEGSLRLSPVVARMVSENRIDPRQIRGSGEGGRITKQDVLAYLEQRRQAAPIQERPAAPQGTAPAAAAIEGAGLAAPLAEQPAAEGPAPLAEQEERLPLTNMRRLIAEHMVRSRRTAAHVTAFIEVDMTELVRLRERLKLDFERRSGVKLTYMAFIAQAAMRAMRDFPLVNSTMDDEGILIKHYVNLGIAVALPSGLIVPVIKRAHEKNIEGLARAIEDLARRAREKRLSPDEVQGGTFTITNPGVFGTVLGTPIINQPQAAILDVEAIVKRPVVVTHDGADSIAIRSMMNLGLSFDHRIFDGAVAAQFLARTKLYLEQANFGL